MKTIRRPATISADARMFGDVELRVHESTNDGLKTETLVISFEEARSLLVQLTSAVMGLTDQRMRNAVAGDCDTCGNARLFHQPNEHGRMEYMHCPDCWERYNTAVPAFPAEPEPERRTYWSCCERPDGHEGPCSGRPVLCRVAEASDA